MDGNVSRSAPRSQVLLTARQVQIDSNAFHALQSGTQRSRSRMEDKLLVVCDAARCERQADKEALLNTEDSMQMKSTLPSLYSPYIGNRFISSNVQYFLMFSALNSCTSASKCSQSTSPKLSKTSFISFNLSSFSPVRQSPRYSSSLSSPSWICL